MNVLITICARGGSKGIPGKNIKKLNSKPLIGYTIEQAFRTAKLYNADIELSTDSMSIKEVASRFGIVTNYLRPAKLATDSSGKISVINDLIYYAERKNKKEYDYILDLDITSPLRTVEDIRTAFSLIENDPEALNIFSVSPSSRNPYFNMVEKEASSNYYKVVKKVENLKTRQSAPVVYDMNASFYIYRRCFFETSRSSTTDKSLVYVMPHICFDIDEEMDFVILDLLLKHNKLGFLL